ncbi:MAG: hypothetical protein ACN4GZ_05415 [Acidimicrobiales bacterium]
MTSQEHIVAVVEPALDGETTIDFAKQVVDRGGRATVVVLFSRKTVAAVTAFANAEDLSYPDAHEIYVERLAENYSARFGGNHQVAFVEDSSDADRVVFGRATRDAATSVAMPQRLVNRRKWKASVARSSIPVVIAPPLAA